MPDRCSTDHHDAGDDLKASSDNTMILPVPHRLSEILVRPYPLMHSPTALGEKNCSQEGKGNLRYERDEDARNREEESDSTPEHERFLAGALGFPFLDDVLSEGEHAFSLAGIRKYCFHL